MLGKYLDKFIIVYLDNIIIYFKIEKEHYKYIKWVLLFYYLFYLLPNSVPFSKSMQAYTFYLQEKSLIREKP